jgi:hypothetical protein
MLDGYCVFHGFLITDKPRRIRNIDHIVIGANGVFAVETKTRRKVKGENGAKVTVLEDALQYKTQSGRQAQLDSLTSRITSGRNEIAALENQIRTIDAELNSTKTTIDSYKAAIGQYEQYVQSEYNVDQYQYQRVLQGYNARLQQREELYVTYKQWVDYGVGPTIQLAGQSLMKPKFQTTEPKNKQMEHGLPHV